MGKQVPSNWTPDQPHPDPRRETFAQKVAAGMAQNVAYRQTALGDIKETSAKANGYRMSVEPSVVSRVEWLRIEALREQNYAATVFTRATMNQLMGDVTTALESAIGALEHAGGNPSTIAALRSELVVHVGRLHRMAPAKPKRTITGPDHVRDGLNRLQVCECQT